MPLKDYRIMLAKRTIIGLVAGCVIIGLGSASLISSLGIQTFDKSETLASADISSFSLLAPADTIQTITITGDLFEVELYYPGIPEKTNPTTHADSLNLEWQQTEDGKSRLAILNVGESDVLLEPTFRFISDPILLVYHVIVTIGGIIIIGFSLGFTMHKPRGF
ncbi:MAG: hypothetical protein R1F52_04170 [Candidatus Nitrosoabyssus spongiisocia]|nr:MAG: hypothetical protein R1F52_04170 [Nitrosopumilaceae archaeon AB1(1)]